MGVRFNGGLAGISMVINRSFYGSTWTWTESGRFVVSCLAGLRDGGILCARERLVEVQSSSACSLGAYWSDT